MELVHNKRDQKRPFERVISLGTSCYSAWLLHELGLRQDAYPFDWLFSTPAMLAHILEDRFRCFLDPAEVRPSDEAVRDGSGARICAHSYYRERFGVEWVFNHHDLSLPDVAASFGRRAARFMAALEDDQKTLLLMVNTGGDTTQQSFERLCGAIDDFGPDNTLLQIDVVRTGDVLDFGMGQPMARARHRRRLFRSTSDIDGVRFQNPIDDLVIKACVTQYPLSSVRQRASDGPPAPSPDLGL